MPDDSTPDSRWDAHNTHKDVGLEAFRGLDPTLRRIERMALRHRSRLIQALPWRVPGIYFLGGGRQVGKTTLVKQSMERLLAHEDVAPERVTYLTGEIFADAEDFRRVVEHAAGGGGSKGGMRYVFVDEVTYVRGWAPAVKFLADAGLLEQTFLLLTGSDLSALKDAMTELPGRRGVAERTDFHLHPLDFLDFCELRGRVDAADLGEWSAGDPASAFVGPGTALPEALDAELDVYLRTGGYLTAVNDLEMHGEVRPATRRIYVDWIRGDVLKRERRETYLRDVLRAIVDRVGSQVTWNALAKDLSIDHPKTVADYCHLLERMDAAMVIPAIREDRLDAAPKKAKKLYFTDPFIHHAVREWLGLAPESDDDVPALVESVVLGHFRRTFPTYHVKAKSEIDVAYVRDGAMFPVEVKTSARMRPKDLAQILKHERAVIAARTRAPHEVEGVPVVPVPVLLLRAARLTRS